MPSLSPVPDEAAPNIHVRVKRSQRSLIEEAARASGKTLSAFVLENALRAAEDELRDRTSLTLTEEQFTELDRVLSQPIDEAAFRRLMTTPAPWD